MELYEAILLLAGVLLLLYVLSRIIRWFINRNTINKIPGPRSSYVLGNFSIFRGKSQEGMYTVFRKMAKQYTTYRLWFGYMAVANLTTAEDIEVVISSMNNLEKGRAYEPLMVWLKTGLLTSDGSKWHNRRKILTPAFHFNILHQFINIFARQSEVLVEELKRECDKPWTNVDSHVVSFTLSTICETAMGTPLRLDTQEQTEYKSAILKLGELLMHRAVRPWLYVDAVFVFTPTYWIHKLVAKKLRTFSGKIIAQRKKTFLGSVSKKIDDAQFISKKRLAMLDLLLSAKEDGLGINDEGIQEEVDTFMFEGHDTTSLSISFTLMLLAAHKDVQEKAYEELVDIFGTSDRRPTYEDLQNLRYLEMCVKESLRLYPSVPMITRNASKDLLTASGYTIPKGTLIGIHIFDLHRDPNVFPDPEKFDPYRFLPENSAGRHPFAYIPFSGGPRNCIGQKFAMLELKTVISTVLRKFILEPVDTPETITLLQDFMVRSRNGIRIKLILRN